MEKKYKWHKVAASKDELYFGSNNLLQLTIDGKKICIAKGKDGLYACTGKCPHAGGNMADGYLDARDHIVCPVHRYTFNLNNGRDVTGEGYFLKIYPVKADETGIYVGIDEGSIFSWIK
jgi:3-phenylpropionate/trans-cinnamate dioxygenase ferredoxin subunit